MKSTLELRDQLTLYNNPFKLSFSISGNESEKNCFVVISFNNGGVFGGPFYQGRSFETKAETVKDLSSILKVALFECEKVLTVTDNIGPGNDGRYLTLPMVEGIISTLSQKETWSVYTGTKIWKKSFLIKEDGLLEGQKICLTYISGEKNGSTATKVLDWDIKQGYSLAFKGELRNANVVQKVEKQDDGSFVVITNEFNCSIVIIEE